MRRRRGVLLNRFLGIPPKLIRDYVSQLKNEIRADIRRGAASMSAAAASAAALAASLQEDEAEAEADEDDEDDEAEEEDAEAVARGYVLTRTQSLLLRAELKGVFDDDGKEGKGGKN